MYQTITPKSLLILFLCSFLIPVASYAKKPLASDPKKEELIEFEANKKKVVELCKAEIGSFSSKGEAQALKEINERPISLSNIKFGILVFDFQGYIKAWSIIPSLVGRNISEISDMTGKPVIRETIDSAKSKQSSWYKFLMINPITSSPKNLLVYYEVFEDSIISCGFFE